MSRRKEAILAWLEQEPIKNDLLGIQALERRIIELEYALAECLDQLNDSLAHIHGPLTSEEKWDEKAMVEQARRNQQYIRDYK